LRGRSLYHITPLHYLPTILQDGALYAKSVLAARGIAPRETASRRDKMLALADYVHFAFEIRTPILADKLNKGYPHAILVFDAISLVEMPGHALLPFNTKAWRSRSAYAPVTENWEKGRLLHRHDTFRELKSLEFLVKYGVGLEALTSVAFVTQHEQDLVQGLCDVLSIVVQAKKYADNTMAPPEYSPITGDAIEEYFAACRSAGELLKPPAIPFD
jgi:hypothetical protein